MYKVELRFSFHFDEFLSSLSSDLFWTIFSYEKLRSMVISVQILTIKWTKKRFILFHHFKWPKILSTFKYFFFIIIIFMCLVVVCVRLERNWMLRSCIKFHMRRIIMQKEKPLYGYSEWWCLWAFKYYHTSSHTRVKRGTYMHTVHLYKLKFIASLETYTQP